MAITFKFWSETTESVCLYAVLHYRRSQISSFEISSQSGTKQNKRQRFEKISRISNKLQQCSDFKRNFYCLIQALVSILNLFFNFCFMAKMTSRVCIFLLRLRVHHIIDACTRIKGVKTTHS